MHFSFLLTCLPLIAIAAPHGEPDDAQPLEERQDSFYPDYGFKGINWAEVDQESVCTGEQRNILLQTAKNIDAGYAQEVTETALLENPAWERFMGGRSRKRVLQPQYNFFVSIDIARLLARTANSARGWFRSN